MKIGASFFEQRKRINKIESIILTAIPEDSHIIDVISALQNIQSKFLADIRSHEVKIEENSSNYFTNKTDNYEDWNDR